MRGVRFALSIMSSVLVVAVGAPARAQHDLPRYSGRSVCMECHHDGRGAEPCSLETIAGHLEAYRSLDKVKAEHIAILCGVTERPGESRICLGCHATGSDAGRRWMAETFDIADGVQCEACHGAGSLHVEAYCDEEIPRDQLSAPWIESGNRTSCTVCHTERLSHEMVLTEGYRVAPADKLYKTPVNLAISPDGGRLYVVCEHSDSVCVVDPIARRVVAEIAVGRRPQDVAVSPDGRTLYVTNRMGDSLTVIDAVTLSVKTEIDIGDEPHGALTDLTGRRVFVANTQGDSISVLDAQSLVEIKRLVAGHGPWSMAMDPSGRFIYVTSVRPRIAQFREPPKSEITIIDARRAIVTGRAVVDAANMLEGIAVVPDRGVALFTLMRTKNLIPTTRVARGWVITNGLGVVWPDGRVDQVLLDAPADYFPDPGDVAVSPDGNRALVTSGGSDQIAVVDVRKLLQTITEASDIEREQVLPNHLGQSSRFVIKRIAAGSNPRGITYSPDGRFAYVANALDDSVSIIETDGYTIVGTIELGGPGTITEIRRGERLFHSATGTFGRQFSCRSCHPDGHINGLTHDIEADGLGLSPVDNRTLRGIVDTGPFKWEGTNPSLHRQCGARLAVFFTRLEPFSPGELDALVRYMCTIERPTNRNREREGLTVSQRRGKAVFERSHSNFGELIPEEGRCVTCHHGSYKTSRTTSFVGTVMWFDERSDVSFDEFDNVEAFGELGSAYFYNLGGRLEFDVPHLNNIYDGAPYLHNGSAATLEEIWTRFNLFDWHGLTKDLTRQQFNDMIEYLKSL